VGSRKPSARLRAADGAQLIVLISRPTETQYTALGLESSLSLVASAEPGTLEMRRSDTEQLSYVLNGVLRVRMETGSFIATRGDVFRIPRGALHAVSALQPEPCHFLEANVPPARFDVPRLTSLLADHEHGKLSVGYPRQTSALEHGFGHASRFVVNLVDVPETNLVPREYLSGGSVGARIVYGSDISMMLATRQPQYHSKPHTHDAEQLNYVLAGELYVFVGDVGFLAHTGDVFRIPRNEVHWSWVQGTMPCDLLETHYPPLTGDPGVLETAVGLLSDEELQARVPRVASVWPNGIDQVSLERRTMGRAS
jgi:quercetin dioxygenase-like cupin family protein